MTRVSYPVAHANSGDLMAGKPRLARYTLPKSCALLPADPGVS